MTSKTDGPGKGAGKPASEGGAPKKPSPIIDLKAAPVEVKEAGSTKPGDDPKDAQKGGEKDAPQPAQAAASGSQSADAPHPAGSAAPPKSTDASASKAKPTANPSGSDTVGEKGPIEERPGKAARASSGVFVHMAAGLVGGFFAFLGVTTLGPRLGLMEDPGARYAREFQRRLAAVEETANKQVAAAADLGSKLAAAENRLAQLDELSTSVAQLEEAHATLAGNTQALEQKVSQPDATAELSARLARLETTLADLSAAAANDPQSGRIPQLAGITGKLNDLEATLNNQLAALRDSLTQQIDARVAQVAEVSEAARSGTQRIDRELASVKEDAARLSQRIDALKAAGDRLDQSLRADREEMASLTAAFESLKGGVAAQLKNVARAHDVNAAIAAVTSQMTALEESLQGVVKGEQERKTRAEGIVLALELSNLKRALDRGGSFAAELAEVEKVAGGKVDLAALERSKDQGVATAAELTREFRVAANAVIDAEAQPSDASVVDRLLLGAKSIVRVRRTDHDANDKSTEAVLGRIEKALTNARLADAVAEAQQLSPKARAAARPWLDKLETRASVDRAIAQLEDQLKASLAGNGQLEKRTQ